MRKSIAVVVVCGAAFFAFVALANAFVAHLDAPNHHPTDCEKWPITVSAHSKSGRPLRAKALYKFLYNGQVVRSSSVYGRNSTKWYPFKGSYSDKLRWPSESVGYRLTFRVALKTKNHGREHIDWWVKVQDGPRTCYFR